MNKLGVAFVDDTDFFTNGKEVQTKIENILKEYMELFKVTRGRIQLEKMFYFAQQWKWNNRKKEIK